MRLFVVLFIVCLVFAGCGGDEVVEKATPAQPETVVPVLTDADTIETDVPETTYRTLQWFEYADTSMAGGDKLQVFYTGSDSTYGYAFFGINRWARVIILPRQSGNLLPVTESYEPIYDGDMVPVDTWVRLDYYYQFPRQMLNEIGKTADLHKAVWTVEPNVIRYYTYIGKQFGHWK